MGQAAKKATRLPIDDPAPEIAFANRSFCFTGQFVFGPRSKCQEAVLDRGGICHDRPTTATDFLVIKTLVSQGWVHEVYGRKVEAALLLQRSQHDVKIVAEEHWVACLRETPPLERPDPSEESGRHTKPPPVPGGGPFAGLTIVLTGTLPSLTREEASAKIEALGGRVSGTVNRKTAFVLAGAEAGSKLERSRQLGIPVIDEADFRRRCSG